MKAIPNGVFKQLAKLTSATRSNRKKRINILYPHHIEALEKANLTPKEFPTMSEILKEIRNSKEKKKKKRGRSFSRQTFFCVGVSDVFRGSRAIHVILKNLKRKHNLKWLRLSMSYHKFSNLRVILQGDLTSKLMEEVGSKDFEELSCNCYNSTKVNGKCAYDGKCRSSMVVYEAKCKCCGKAYIGNTQQKLKTRMTQHFNDTRKVVNCGVQIDGNKSFVERKSNFLYEIIWQTELPTLHE